VFTFARAHYGADGIPDWSIRELRVTRGTTRLLFSRQSAFSFLTVASNAHGEQVVAWLEGTPAGGNDLYAGFRKAGTVFRARRLSGARFDPPSIALASTGAAAVAWERGYGTLIYAAGRPPGGALGGVGLISSRSLDDFVYNPWVAVAPSGRALVTWEGFSRRGGYHQRAAFRSRGGRRVGIQDLGRTNSFARLNSVALDSHGNGRVVWSNALDVIAALGSLPPR
jgi:hypothetical protein